MRVDIDKITKEDVLKKLRRAEGIHPSDFIESFSRVSVARTKLAALVKEGYVVRGGSLSGWSASLHLTDKGRKFLGQMKKGDKHECTVRHIKRS